MAGEQNVQSEIENALKVLRKAVLSEHNDLVEKHKTRYEQLQASLADAEAKNKRLKEIYFGQIRVIARSRITHKEKVVRMVALAEQALKDTKNAAPNVTK